MTQKINMLNMALVTEARISTALNFTKQCARRTIL